MKITIWGARGSIPSPLKPEDIREKIYRALLGAIDVDISSPEAVRAYVDNLSPLLSGTAGGNTPCVEIQAGEETFIIDAGSGLRELGLKLMEGPCGRGQGTLHMFFSHAHWDHIQGFPFFRPAFIPGNRLIIYSIHDLETVLKDQQRFINFPVPLSYMQAGMEFKPFPVNSSLTIGGVKISAIKNAHPGDAYSFRFENDDGIFVHASDAEYKQLKEASLRPYLDFFHNAGVLIFDAQFTLKEALDKEDWGHSSSLIGADIARRAGVKKLVLFHHDPTYSDEALQQIQEITVEYQAQDTTRPTCEVIVAYEGLTFNLKHTSTTALQYVPDSHAAILTPQKTLDEHSVDDLERRLAHLDQTGWPARLIIDLSQVEALTMAGLKTLVSLNRAQEETSILLVAPSTPVKKVIELAGFLDVFAIYPSVEAALSVFRAHDTLQLSGQLLKQHYKLEYKVGRSQLGTVFKATDIHLERTVAVKILSASFNQKTINHFLKQARQIMDLDHPSIVKVYDCDEDQGLSYIAKEFIEAPTLQDVLDAGAQTPFPVEQALNIGLQITAALHYAHSHSVIHGDLKPKNVLLADKLKISDFGLGKLEEGHRLLDAPLIVLTAEYLAPEQILGRPIDARTDLYALGVILYRLFTGQSPFYGADQEIMQAHLHIAPVSPLQLNPRLPHALAALILNLLAKEADDRCPTAEQAHQILDNLAANGKHRAA